MTDDVELKERLSKLSDEELIEMVTAGKADYRQLALDYAKAELKYRRVDWSDVEPQEPEIRVNPIKIGESDAAAAVAVSGRTCPCGGPLREATLVAEKELTVIFSDNREERFVRVMACAQCGQVALTVDYDNEVTP